VGAQMIHQITTSEEALVESLIFLKLGFQQAYTQKQFKIGAEFYNLNSYFATLFTFVRFTSFHMNQLNVII